MMIPADEASPWITGGCLLLALILWRCSKPIFSQIQHPYLHSGYLLLAYWLTAGGAGGCPTSLFLLRNRTPQKKKKKQPPNSKEPDRNVPKLKPKRYEANHNHMTASLPYQRNKNVNSRTCYISNGMTTEYTKFWPDTKWKS